MKFKIIDLLQLNLQPFRKCWQSICMQCRTLTTERAAGLLAMKLKKYSNVSSSRQWDINPVCNSGTKKYSVWINRESVEWPKLPTPGIKRKMHSTQ